MWPNSKITSISSTDVNQFSKKKGYWKSLRNFIDFASLEGEKYDTLCNILKSEVCKSMHDINFIEGNHNNYYVDDLHYRNVSVHACIEDRL